MKKSAILSFLVICFSISLFAQENQTEPTKDFVLFKLTDGNTYLGSILTENNEFITIKTKEFEELKIRKATIKSRKTIASTELHQGEYWFENPNSTRNLYGPTGYGLKKGEGYYQNFMLLFNGVSYGFTDNFTLGIATMPFTFGEGLFININPKLSFPIVKDKFNVGAGVSYTNAFESSFGIAYGVATLGSRDNNFTIGLGYGNVEGEWAKSPIITFSGMMRVSKRFAFVTENWLLPNQNYNSEYDPATNSFSTSQTTEYQFLLTYGVRLMFESISIDLGFLNNKELSESLIIGFPIVGISVPFGKK